MRDRSREWIGERKNKGKYWQEREQGKGFVKEKMRERIGKQENKGMDLG